LSSLLWGLTELNDRPSVFRACFPAHRYTGNWPAVGCDERPGLIRGQYYKTIRQEHNPTMSTFVVAALSKIRVVRAE
jgi:hypothetical protein